MTCKYQDDKQYICRGHLESISIIRHWVLPTDVVPLWGGDAEILCCRDKFWPRFLSGSSVKIFHISWEPPPGDFRHWEMFRLFSLESFMTLLFRSLHKSFNTRVWSRDPAFVGSEILCWKNLVSTSDPPCLLSNMCSLKQWTPFFPVASVAIPGVIVTCFHMRGRQCSLSILWN